MLTLKSAVSTKIQMGRLWHGHHNKHTQWCHLMAETGINAHGDC